MTPNTAPRSRRRLLLGLTLGSGAGLVVLLLVLASRVPISSHALRQKVVETLAERLDAEVELAELHLRVFPRFHAEGAGLTIRHKRRHDVPPLISVKSFSLHADLAGLMRKHVDQVRLNGLEIDIPPSPHDDDDDKAEGARKGGEPAKADETPRAGKAEHKEKMRAAREYIVDNLVSSDAKLVIIPRKKDKQPKVWAIHELYMRTVAFDRAMPFDATLTNAVPPGEIATKGSFGPWHAEDPGATPLKGTFTFAKADLSVFKGISGILSAHGEFGGTLDRIGIHGETDTPDFTVAVSGHPVPLHTDYRATVDGTNGDTLLDRIDGKFLNTSLVAKGSVIDLPGKAGREVRLDVTMENARLEDVLRLAVKQAKSPMQAALKLMTKLVLPPGDRDVVEKLRLDGQFSIARAKFTDLDVQKKLNELSNRSLGNAPNGAEQNVVSDFNGRFRLADGTLALQPLTFTMPGARVALDGSYGLKSEMINFKGTLFMDAKISETQTGFKRVLLKAIDPLFKGDGGGSAIPIKIEGSRSNPAFGLDKGRVFHRGG
jgi:hypothetical protein